MNDRGVEEREGKIMFGLPEGAIAESSLHMLSRDLLQGCMHFAEKARLSKVSDDTAYANMAAVLLSTSMLEARLNEWVAILAGMASDKSSAFWKNLCSMQKDLKVEDKWNMIASYQNATLWDNSVELFQSYTTITSLRNEIVHYKGRFMKNGEAPNNRVKDLMQRFGVSTEGNSSAGDIAIWVRELLTKKDLGTWVYEKTKKFHDAFYELLMVAKP